MPVAQHLALLVDVQVQRPLRGQAHARDVVGLTPLFFRTSAQCLEVGFHQHVDVLVGPAGLRVNALVLAVTLAHNVALKIVDLALDTGGAVVKSEKVFLSPCCCLLLEYLDIGELQCSSARLVV